MNLPPLSKGSWGDLNYLPLRHCEERPMRRGNLIPKNSELRAVNRESNKKIKIDELWK